MHGTGGSVGEAVGPITAGVLVGFFIWRTVLKVSIIPGVAMAILIAIVLRGLRGESGGSESFRSYLGLRAAGLIRQPAMITILVITGGFISAQASVYTFLPIYLREDFDVLFSGATSAFLSVAQVSGIISQPAMGFLSDRFSRKAVILPSILMLGITVFAIPLAGSGIPLLLVVVVMGAFNFPLMAIILAAALDVSGDDVPATRVSLVFGATVVFSSLTPALAGVLADATDDLTAAFLHVRRDLLCHRRLRSGPQPIQIGSLPAPGTLGKIGAQHRPWTASILLASPHHHQSNFGGGLRWASFSYYVNCTLSDSNLEQESFLGKRIRSFRQVQDRPFDGSSDGIRITVIYYGDGIHMSMIAD